jgi:hypothetical protein
MGYGEIPQHPGSPFNGLNGFRIDGRIIVTNPPSLREAPAQVRQGGEQ